MSVRNFHSELRVATRKNLLTRKIQMGLESALICPAVADLEIFSGQGR